MPTDTGAAAQTRPYSALFVDDNPHVLRGLERLLRPMRSEWSMQFVSSGAAALEFLQEEHADVLITDMRMPGMSGVELMERVLREHPGVVRIALSGRAERETVIRAAQLAHQYLSKPCEPDLLRERLLQAVRLRSLLGNEQLQAIVSRISSLRSIPSIYVELMAELENPNPSVARIASIVAHDAGLTAKVLQVINSAYFGLRAHVSDPETAVRLLGLDTVRSLALAVQVYSSFGPSVVNPSAIWAHGSRTARIARHVAACLDLPASSASEAFTAALLHDVGRLILAEAMEEYEAVADLGRAEGLDHASAETRAFGTNHAQVGAYLFGLWGLPYGLVEAIAWHHAPSESGIAQASALTALHIADALDHAGHPEGDCHASVDASYLESLGLTAAFARWRSSGLGEFANDRPYSVR